MRIAHVLRRLSFDDWGGTEQVVWNLAKAQKAAGHDVRLFATTALCARENEVVEGIEILRFKPIYPWWPMPKAVVATLDLKGGNPFVPGLGKALREWRPDVIHCHAMGRIAEICIRIAERMSHVECRKSSGCRPSNVECPSRPSTKCVISLHGGGANIPGVEAKSLKAPTRGRLPWGKMIDYALGWTRRIPEDADGIVCVGEDEYERYRAVHPHVMYLPNGVDTSLFKSEKLKVESEKHGNSKLSTLNSKLIISLLCVARIDRQKNQMALVEALVRHPDMSLRLVGPVTQPDYLAELKDKAASLGVSDRVAFVGALAPGSPELLAEYARARAFVLASRHEPFGIVVLEAWAAGLPVVASDVGGLGRLCAAHPGAAITFSHEDPGSLDRALDELRRRIASGEAAAMSDAGRRAAAEYDWRNLSSRLVDFYAEI